MTPMPVERRRRRTADTLLALRYQLEVCRSDGALQALMISDEDGLPMVQVGAADALGEIAANLPILERRSNAFEGVVLSPRGAPEITVRKFHVDDGHLFVCAVGGRRHSAATLVARTIRGAQRILGMCSEPA
jgi:hypothetical protein